MKKILIIGAGEGGRRLLSEIRRVFSNSQALGFIDDSPKLQGQLIDNLNVLGKIHELPEIAKKNQVHEIIVAIPSLRGSRLKKIIDIISATGLPFKILPGIFESIEYMVKGQVPYGKLRKLELADLLDRPPIKINLERVCGYLRGKTILITGAGGSIGAEIVRQLSHFGVEKLILIDIYENNLYNLHLDLKISHEPIVADIKDKAQLEQVFQKFKPQIVFHAAAHKHVPLMEREPHEAIKNNILGSSNLIQTAIKNQVEKFVFISTDKAINPTSIMGATKRFTEQEILQTQGLTNFIIVRFGNVLGSYGSVIPVWEKQLNSGQPLTVTHPEMKRFFMTIPEAVQLVIEAGSMKESKAVFVLNMGKEYKILDLAYDFIKLAGKFYRQDAKIEFTRPRPGEKLSETLYESCEKLLPSGHKLIYKIQSKVLAPIKFQKILTKFKKEIHQMSRNDIVQALKEIIPTYIPYQEIMKPKKSPRIIEFSPPAIGAGEIREAVTVLKKGWLTMGRKVVEFEEQFSKFHKTRNAIAVSSATAGLHLALVSLGIGPGDEVILPSYTFASCANTIVWVGAKPVFVDIQEGSFLLDPEDVQKKVTAKTKAIMVVHFGGQMAEMDQILKIAKKHNLKVIEDCAHSPSATYKRKLAGTFGDIGVFSFYANKNLTTGEGGMIITDHDTLAQKMRTLRLHGMNRDAYNRYSSQGSWQYQITEAGFKYNLTDLAAAIGIEQFKKLKSLNQKRQEVAEEYLEKFKNTPDVILPSTLAHRSSVWHLFPIRVPSKERDNLIVNLRKYNIISSVHFTPLHLQPFYMTRYDYKKEDLPQSELVFSQEVSLPMHPNLSQKDVGYITEVVKYLLKDV